MLAGWLAYQDGYGNFDGNSDFALMRYNADGTLDTTFGGGTGMVTTSIGVHDSGLGSVQQTDGKLVVIGTTHSGGHSDFALARYNADGSLDTTFGGGDGIITTSIGDVDSGFSVIQQADGKLVLVGYTRDGGANNDLALLRYTTDGALDTTFGADGIVTSNLGPPGTDDNFHSIIQQEDGNLVVAGGSDGDFVLARYNPDGTLDPLFGAGDGIVTTDLGSDPGLIWSMIQQPDGRLVGVGQYLKGGYRDLDFALARYTADGILDATFAPVHDQTIQSGSTYALTIPQALFYDPESGRVLPFTLSEANGGPLPDWLGFDAVTGTLSGTPPVGADDVTLRLTATDPLGATTSLDFTLSISDPLIVFSAHDPLHGTELWRTDGTTTGTALVKDIRDAQDSSAPRHFKAMEDGRALFAATDATRGEELWITDGTAGGTTLLKDIWVGSGNSNPRGFAAIGDSHFLFTATDATHGEEVWLTDGTNSGTVMLKDIVPGVDSSYPVGFTSTADGRVLFQAADELWITDGTAVGTVLLKDNSAPQEFTAVGDGRFVFTAEGTIHGWELWITDVTTMGTLVLKDINPGPNASNPLELTAVGHGRVIFRASDGASGPEPWITDGTAVGTLLLKDIDVGASGSNPREFAALGDGRVLFTASDGIHGSELWVTDGTPVGTSLLRDLWSSGSSNPYGFVSLGDGRMLFSAWTSEGIEPWVTTGTTDGTVLLKDIWVGPGFSLPGGFTAIGDGRLVFRAADAASGAELWITDGTTAGTVLLRDIALGLDSASPSSFAVLNPVSSGKETYFGAAGIGTFSFSNGFGADTITNFLSGEDQIDLSTVTNPDWSTFADVQAHMTQSGADTLIDFGGGNTITLVGVTAGSLTAADFVL